MLKHILLRIKQNGNISDTKLLAMAAHGITHGGEHVLCIYVQEQQLQIKGQVNFIKPRFGPVIAAFIVRCQGIIINMGT